MTLRVVDAGAESNKAQPSCKYGMTCPHFLTNRTPRTVTLITTWGGCPSRRVAHVSGSRYAQRAILIGILDNDGARVPPVSRFARGGRYSAAGGWPTQARFWPEWGSSRSCCLSTCRITSSHLSFVKYGRAKPFLQPPRSLLHHHTLT